MMLDALTRRSRDGLAREIPGWLGAVLIGGTLVAVSWLQHRRPLRRSVEPGMERETRNFAMAAMSAAAIQVAEKPLATRLAMLVHRRRWGLVKQASVPPAVEIVLAVVLLDYTLYVWHVLTHRVPFLWKIHRVHHADLDLTASTALRFHFAEMVLSVPWRLGQIVVVGASPRALSVWQTMTLVAILFHHANLELPVAIERWLCRLFMTPRMHGIHHSVVQEETDANWSTIFSWPDYLHGTYRLNVPQDEVTIGVPEFRAPADVGLLELVEMPLSPKRPAPGAAPKRTALPPSTLAP